jgi:hypothetical protein
VVKNTENGRNSERFKENNYEDGVFNGNTLSEALFLRK